MQQAAFISRIFLHKVIMTDTDDDPPSTALSLSEQQRAGETAAALNEYRGYGKGDVAAVLGSATPFNQEVCRRYMALQNFAGIGLVHALRQLLSKFLLTTEAYEVDRIAQAFARRYVEQNPNSLTVDKAAILTSAVLLLNADLHSPNNDKRMTAKQFVDNLREIEGADFDEELLKAIYKDIRDAEIVSATRSPVSSEPEPKYTMATGRPEAPLRHFFKDETLGTKLLESSARMKNVTQEGGKPYPKGQRGWELVHLTLCEPVVIIHQSKNKPMSPEQITQNMHDVMLLRHSFACVARHYAKKTGVFLLTLSSGRSALMCVESDELMGRWVDALNRVAASTSAPPLPAPVTSASSKFRRPVLPESRSRETKPEMISRYQTQLQKIKDELLTHEHRSERADAQSQGRGKYWVQKHEYLLYERDRIGAYLAILQSEAAESQHVNGSASSESNTTSEGVVMRPRSVAASIRLATRNRESFV